MTGQESLIPARECLACDEGAPLVNATADRPDLPDLWVHQYGGDPGTIAPCTAGERRDEDCAGDNQRLYANRADVAARSTPPGSLCAARERLAHEWVVRVVHDDLDGGWVASVQQLPGCISQGETVPEALANVSEAFVGCLEALKGWPKSTANGGAPATQPGHVAPVRLNAEGCATPADSEDQVVEHTQIAVQELEAMLLFIASVHSALLRHYGGGPLSADDALAEISTALAEHDKEANRG